MINLLKIKNLEKNIWHFKLLLSVFVYGCRFPLYTLKSLKILYISHITPAVQVTKINVQKNFPFLFSLLSISENPWIVVCLNISFIFYLLRHREQAQVFGLFLFNNIQTAPQTGENAERRKNRESDIAVKENRITPDILCRHGWVCRRHGLVFITGI